MRTVHTGLGHALVLWTQAWYEKLSHLWMRDIDIKTAVTWGLMVVLIIGVVLVIVVCILMQLLAPLTRL